MHSSITWYLTPKIEMDKVVIVGGGIAGLTTAHYLQQAGVDFLLIEATEKLGGKVATEQVNGFLLDKGFQVFLTAYPEVENVLDVEALQLKHFEPGAVVRYKNRFVEVGDPFRQPKSIFKSAFSPIGSVADKLKVLKLTKTLKNTSLEDLFKTPETTTLTDLVQVGFSQKMIDVFFRPFLGGIFLERQMQTSNRFFHFVFKMFAEGTAALPTGGIQKIADQLAANIPPEKLMLGKKVINIENEKVFIEDGSSLEAEQVVVTCPLPFLKDIKTRTYNKVCNLYYAASAAPIKGAKLMLNGAGSGLINNVVFVSEVDKTVAPEGKTLVSVSVIGNPNLSDSQLNQAVSEELNDWFGMVSKTWKLIQVNRLEKALPLSTQIDSNLQPQQLTKNMIVVGQHIHYGSLNAVMESGRKAAEWVMQKK